jgi:trehalose 6-phosphate phosphatase
LNRPNSPTSSRQPLASLLRSPERSAIVCDVDGTLAPIAPRPEEAAVPTRTRDLLERIARRFALVGCISGRRAEDARRLVGIRDLAYVGNHGLEYLAPGAAHADAPPGLEAHAASVRSFATASYGEELRHAGVRLEDKDSIWSFHWREADDEEAARERLARVAEGAAEQGLVPHWGRKVLEIRPPLAIDKGTAVERLLSSADVDHALYAGDDTTDLDAFRKLEMLVGEGRLKDAIRVGIRSQEAPAAILDEADLVVTGPDGFVELLEELA